jgi:AcrR family transcriptional regulator
LLSYAFCKSLRLHPIVKVKKIYAGNFGIEKCFHSFAPGLFLEIVELKDHILTEADKLFCQCGIKSITMDDIARHLGMSKKTIYQHYRDKNDLVQTLIKNKMETEVCVMDQNSAEALNAVDEVFRAVTHMESMLSNINPILFYDLQKYHPEAWLIFKNFRESNLYKVIRQNLDNGIEQGYYRKEINQDIISTMRIEQIDMAFNHSLNLVNKYGVYRVMKEITEHYLYGICTPMGYKLIDKYKHSNIE